MWDEEYWHLENLMNLEQIGRPHGFQLVVLPVKWVGHDGRAGARGGGDRRVSRVLAFGERGCLEVAARRRQGRVARAHERRSACRCRRASSCPPRRLAAALPDGGAELRALAERQDADAAQALIAHGRARPGAARAVLDAYAALGAEDVPVAVRSSACAEDSEAASLRRPAGDLPARPRRRRRCARGSATAGRRSSPSARSSTARRRARSRTSAWPSSCSGWSARTSPACCSPATRCSGRRDRMVVEAVLGLGEAAVSGPGDARPLRAQARRHGSSKAQVHAAALRDRARRDGRRRGARSSARRRAAHARLGGRAARAARAASATTSSSGSAFRRTSSGRSRAASSSCSRRGR